MSDIEAMATLVARVNGLAPVSDRVNAAMDTIGVLMADHELAARLLGFRIRREWEYRDEGSVTFNYITPNELVELKDSDVAIGVRTREIWVSDWEEVPGWRESVTGSG